MLYYFRGVHSPAPLGGKPKSFLAVSVSDLRNGGVATTEACKLQKLDDRGLSMAGA